MAEDHGLCTHFRYHQHKLVLFLSAMRHFAAELKQAGFDLEYQKLETKDQTPFEKKLKDFVQSRKLSHIHSFEVSDRFFEQRLETCLKELGVQWVRHPSPGFVTPRSEFAAYLSSTRKPFMKTFYERQRRRLGILMRQTGSKKDEPEGGQFSYDAENRQPLPDEITPPGVRFEEPDPVTQEVIRLVESQFSSHPGQASQFSFPVTRKGAQRWLTDFVSHRLEHFGTYEDALSMRDPFLFHSVLTPFLNTGLLEPLQAVEAVLQAWRKKKAPLNSIEGFIRQVIGWREFIFGIDRHFGPQQFTTNHWNHSRRLTQHWYDGTTGLPPLDSVIKKLERHAYSHHIERLMVVGTLMLGCEIHPHEAYRWFMEMHIDSADWVMGPNVFGMGIFSDGGVFATKPYLCGSNYWLKMGDYARGDWCDVADGLYWGFIARNQKALIKNPRMATIARSLDRMGSERREKILRAAESFKDRVTRLK
jgi:deoxyribodipyrimidine photolyase-related protein